MADSKISALTSASTPLAGTEVLPIVQSGATVKASISNVQTATYSTGTANGVTYLNSSKVLTSGSALVFDGTNLGLGTASPDNGGGSAKWFTVDANSGSGYSGGVIYRINGVRQFLQYQDSDNLFAHQGAGSNAGQKFFVGSSEGMRLTSTGLGIGTSSPRSNVDVSGSVLVGTYQTSTNYAPLSVKTSSTITTPSTFTNAINIWNGTNAGEYSNITFGYNSLGLTNASAYIGFVSTSSAGAGKGDLVFGARDVTTDTAATERMRIDSAGIVTMSAYGAGAATFSAAGVISSVSDERWKIKDGVPSNPDAMLKKLEPGYWYYNDEKKETFGADRQLGFYAQNVNAAIGPEAAPEPEEGKPCGYYDRSVLAVTVMALQKALVTIESLKARLDAANL